MPSSTPRPPTSTAKPSCSHASKTCRGISHLTVARSANGVDGWSIDPDRCSLPPTGVASEQWGFEDPRVVWVDELERWVITCTAYGPAGPGGLSRHDRGLRHRSSATASSGTRRTRTRRFSRTGSTAAGSSSTGRRPSSAAAHGEIVLSRSADLVSWSAPEQVLQPRDGAWWDSLRIGIGPPPLRTEHGWLLVYHGVKDTVSGHAVSRRPRPPRPRRADARPATPSQLDPRPPRDRTSEPATFPTSSSLAASSTTTASGEVRLYYGAADDSICLATARLDDLLEAVLAAPDEAYRRSRRPIDRLPCSAIPAVEAR